MQETLLQFIQHIQVVLLVTGILGGIAGGALTFTQILTPDRGESAIPPLIREYQAIRQEINEKNLLAQEVMTLGRDRVVWSDLVQSLLDTLPPGTTINRIQGSIITSNLEFSGASVNRNSLIILQERLEQLPWVKDVASPLQNLLVRDRPDYSFSITLSPPGEQEAEAAQ